MHPGHPANIVYVFLQFSTTQTIQITEFLHYASLRQ